ncbi:hypothetical protein [Massilia putida]|uniref:hypothetical protein n=1 Tax=Massilia putida TaxID=1141883 RepID=UPI000952D2AA|nr:hypothetical protein [Massilia putida]
MSLSRRQFVSGSILLGASLAAGSTLAKTLSSVRASGTWAADSPLLIRTGLPLDQDLANGTAAAMRALGGGAVRELRLPARLEGGLDALAAQLEPYRKQCLVGIMIDSSFMLLQEAVRDFSGAVLWHSAHMAGRCISGAELGHGLVQVAAGLNGASEVLGRQCEAHRTGPVQEASFVSFVIEI